MRTLKKAYNPEHYKKFADGKTRRILYDHELPFSKGLDRNLNALKDRIKLKKASLLIIDGGVGEGKTTLGVHCASYFQDSVVDLKKQYAMGGIQFQEKLQICSDSGLPVIIYDEAGDFNKRGSLTAFNQRLNRVFETYRGFRILVILILPSFQVLDNKLFDNKIPRLLLNCFERTDKYGNYKGYSLFRMFYLKHKMKKLIVPAHAYTQTEPNFYGHYLDLPPKVSAKLEKISIEGKKAVLSESILSNRGLISAGDIAKKLHMSRPWVTVKVKQLKIKTKLKYKMKHYYDNDIVDQLKEEIKI